MSNLVSSRRVRAAKWSCVVVSLFIMMMVRQVLWVNKFRKQWQARIFWVHDQAHQNFIGQVEELDGMSESLRLLLSKALSFDEEKGPLAAGMARDSGLDHDHDDGEDMKERCERYGFQVSTQPKRRIFWGSLIADDSWHVVAFAAMEYHGLFDTISFIESNTTQSEYLRTMRFPEGSQRKRLLTDPKLWGSNTRVHVDYFYSNSSEYYKGKALLRENDQRDRIFERWKQNGMTHRDIGFISDVDEVATRDFLLALQGCHVPEFFPTLSDALPANRPHDCLQAKIFASSFVFEGSPKCLTIGRRWFHPDFVVGECVQGVGDPRLDVPHHFEYSMNIRAPKWKDHVAKVPFGNVSVPLGPLWDAADFRMLADGAGRQIYGISKRNGTVTKIETAYHFHNFFESLEVLRWKYMTYGHPHGVAVMNISLREIESGDVKMMLDCLSDSSTAGRDWRGGSKTERLLFDPVLDTPIAFQVVPEYMELRHAELQQEVFRDQSLHPANNRSLRF